MAAVINAPEPYWDSLAKNTAACFKKSRSCVTLASSRLNSGLYRLWLFLVVMEHLRAQECADFKVSTKSGQNQFSTSPYKWTIARGPPTKTASRVFGAETSGLIVSVSASTPDEPARPD